MTPSGWLSTIFACELRWAIEADDASRSGPVRRLGPGWDPCSSSRGGSVPARCSLLTCDTHVVHKVLDNLRVRA